MLKNPLMEELRAQISSDEKAQMDESFAIADRIHFLLKKHNITQRQLSEKLCKRESEISKWLSGGHNFTIQTLTKISLALGEKVYDIPGIDANKNNDEILSNSLKSSFIRLIHHVTSIKVDLTYQPYSSVEISELEVDSCGVLCKPRSHKETGNNFTEAYLSPEEFRNIDQLKLS